MVLIAAAFRYGNYITRDHSIEEMQEDDVTIEFVEDAMGRDKPKIIEARSGVCLILGWAGQNEPLHTVVAYDKGNPLNYRLLTVYRPDKEPHLWTNNYEKRK